MATLKRGRGKQKTGSGLTESARLERAVVRDGVIFYREPEVVDVNEEDIEDKIGETRETDVEKK